MEIFAQVFDVSLLATVALIFFLTLIGAYLRSSRRDPCLRSFEGYHVTIERSSGQIVWGELHLESTGLELAYKDSIQDSNHIESSYILYSAEFEDIQAMFRYVDELDEEEKARREKDLRRYFHPGPVVRVLRGTQHFFALANDSMSEVLGMIMGSLKKPAGRYITDASDEHLKRFSTEVVGSVGTTYDPLLERFVGQKVVVDLMEDGIAHEHVAIFKNYSPDFYELLDVQFPQQQSLPLPHTGEVEHKALHVECTGKALRVSNLTRQPILLQSIMLDGTEEMLNVLVDGDETVELHPEIVIEQAHLNVRVVRELDMIVPRSRCLVRHRADRYEPSLIPEIIFDLGVMLRGESRLDAQEERLRRQLEQYPNSALIVSNLGAIVMQKQQYDEAQKLLEQAYALRQSLPDNGRRTLMLLHELKRRKEKSPQMRGRLAARADQRSAQTVISQTLDGSGSTPVPTSVTVNGATTEPSATAVPAVSGVKSGT